MFFLVTVVNCGPPPVVDFGTTNDASYNYQDLVTYTCMAGFEPGDGSPNVTLTCGADGQWSGYMPCQGTHIRPFKKTPVFSSPCASVFLLLILSDKY